MPASLESLQSDLATIRVPIGGQLVTVVYRPSVLDQDTWEKIRTSPPGTPDEKNRTWISNQAPAFVLEVVTQWDLRRKEMDERPIPITEEELRSVPTPVLQIIMDRINVDLVPNLKRSAPSDNGLLHEE